ncbi:MAG: hypothetical protein RIB46_07600 [Pseudomonadales bacterium]
MAAGFCGSKRWQQSNDQSSVELGGDGGLSGIGLGSFVEDVGTIDRRKKYESGGNQLFSMVANLI